MGIQLDGETVNRETGVKVTCYGRETGMGAFTESYLYSARQQKLLKPRRESSRTGNHWTDTYYLLPGFYYEATYNRTNSGKTSINLRAIYVSAGQFEGKTLFDSEIPEWLWALLPAHVKRYLRPNPEF